MKNIKLSLHLKSHKQELENWFPSISEVETLSTPTKVMSVFILVKAQWAEHIWMYQMNGQFIFCGGHTFLTAAQPLTSSGGYTKLLVVAYTKLLVVAYTNLT